MSGALFFCFSSASSHYIFTVGGFSVLTPDGFILGQHYDFDSQGEAVKTSRTYKSINELELPLPDSRRIIFKYPDIISLGRPSYLSSEISQSVDFKISKPEASGLIQIWHLTTSLEDFLESSKSFSTVDYLSFESKNGKKGNLSYTLWDYTFKSGGKTIRGLEAFFDDRPYMYRISVFLDDAEYNESFQALFNEMVQSVTVR
jgi:hypothetical protein